MHALTPHGLTLSRFEEELFLLDEYSLLVTRRNE